MNEENTMQQGNHDAAQAAPATSDESSPSDAITFS